jgi:NAD(P)-dependent dehydrogenase (short-subunit alcohol dehydrogenase family)
LTICFCSIGLAIAERLGHEGAHVVVSSRKKDQVDKTVESLQKQGLSVTGLPCHVGSKDDRKKLFDLVSDKYVLCFFTFMNYVRYQELQCFQFKAKH